MAREVEGAFAAEYQTLLTTASLDRMAWTANTTSPGAFMEAGPAYLIERELGRDGSQLTP